MKTTFAGAIGCSLSDDFVYRLSINAVDKYHWKKIFDADSTLDSSSNYSNVQVVDTIESIVEDQDISLVVLSNKYLHVVPQLLKAGKSVRTI